MPYRVQMQEESMSKLEKMREELNNLKIPFDMKKQAFEFYEKGYNDAIKELRVSDEVRK